MANSCIDRSVLNQMKAAVRSGEISIPALYNNTTEGRRQIFSKFASEELAEFINTNFEKAMASKQADALQKWVERTFTPEQKAAESYNGIQDRIKALKETGVLNPANADAFLYDFVAEKMGVAVSQAEIMEIGKKADALEDLFKKKNVFGYPDNPYWVARRELDNYILALEPTSGVKIAVSTIGRSNMLARFSSGTLNIVSNIVRGIEQAFQRRMETGVWKGLVGKASSEYIKMAIEIYNTSGYDITRMVTLNDERIRSGEQLVHTQGEGKIRAIGRFYEDIVFNKLLGFPDLVSAATASADAMNLGATQVAVNEGLKGAALEKRAEELFRDAASLDPQTAEGQLLKANAIASAQISTWTNDSSLASFSLGVRGALNKFGEAVAGGVPLGDAVMPFVKVPANVIAGGIDFAGFAAIKGLVRIPEAIRQLKAGNKKPMEALTRLMISQGLGLTFVAVLSMLVDPDDYIPDYSSLSPSERALVEAKGGKYNAIKFGDKYVSVDYLGPLGAAFVGMLYVRKFGKDKPVHENLINYFKGVGMQLTKLPGVKEFSDMMHNIKETLEDQDLGKTAQGLTDESVAFIRARVVPGFVYDLSKGLDKYERDTGRSQLGKTQAAFPGVRQGLPVKVSQITGEKIKTEGFISSMLFGSRVGTASKNPVVKEIARLSDTGNTPVLTKIANGKRMKELSAQIGKKKFQEALEFFGKAYGRDAGSEIKKASYKSADDEDKKKLLDGIRDEILEDTLTRFHYKKPKKGEK